MAPPALPMRDGVVTTPNPPPRSENVIASLHNVYTLRGAPVRDPLNWSKYIGELLYRFGLEAEVMFASHHWPRWGNARVQEVLRGQRDLYANSPSLVDRTLSG